MVAPDNANKPLAAATMVEAVTLHTSSGDIRLRLLTEHAPKTVANFVGLASGLKAYTRPNARGTYSGPFYDGSLFHRVIAGAWIQGGDPTGTGRGHPGYHFGDEFHPDLIFNRPYLLAMANAGPGTNGSQFFITLTPQPQLNFRNPIFGYVDDRHSSTVVEAIADVPTGHGDRPLEDIVLNHVELHTPAQQDPVPMEPSRTGRWRLPGRTRPVREQPR